MSARDSQLSGEESIVWLEPPERFPYVRETVVMDARTRRRPLPWMNMPGRLVGYSVLRPTAESWTPGWFIRRAFWVKEYDRSEERDGIYAVSCPAEAVDPRTVMPGILGSRTARAWGCDCFDPSDQRPGHCYDCRNRRTITLRTGTAVRGHHPARKA